MTTGNGIGEGNGNGNGKATAGKATGIKGTGGGQRVPAATQSHHSHSLLQKRHRRQRAPADDTGYRHRARAAETLIHFDREVAGSTTH